MAIKNRKRLPWQLTRPHTARPGGASALEVPIGGFLTIGDETFIVFRQLKREGMLCRGCYFFETCGRDRECPENPCENIHRSDRCNVIYKLLTP